MKEIEKKYLLKDSVKFIIKKLKLPFDKITQYYTHISPCKEVRYRNAGEIYYKTIKHGIGAVREEKEKEISKKKFKKKFPKHIKHIIRKDRCYLHLNDKKYIIDCYKKDLKGLFTLEIEFPSLSEFQEFEIPELLEAYIIKDVTNDERYKNKNIAFYGKPKEKSYNLDEIFNHLEKIKNRDIDFDFMKKMSASDAIRVILYKFFLSIMYYKDKILERNDEEDLHQFRINIRKSRAFIKEFDFLFDEEVNTHLNENLSKIASFTNKKRDLDVIKKRLLQLHKENKNFYTDLNNQIDKEQHKIKDMLKSDEFDLIFQSYQFFLKEDSNFYLSPRADKAIHKTAKEVIETLHRKIIKKINSLEKKFSVKKLHKIRIAFKKLRYLLEEFKYLFDENNISKLIEKGKKLQTILGDFNDTINQKELLHIYFETHRNQIENCDELEEVLLGKTSETEGELIKKAKKELHKFKQKSLKF